MYIIIVIYLLLINKSIIGSGYIEQGLYKYSIQPNYPLYMLYFLFFLPVLLGLFFLSSLNAANNIKKSQNRYVFIGTLISSNVSLFTNLIMPYLEVYYLNGIGQLSINFWIIMLIYGITRYKFISLEYKSKNILQLIIDVSIVIIIISLYFYIFFEFYSFRLENKNHLNLYFFLVFISIYVYLKLLSNKIFDHVLPIFFPAISIVNKLDNWLKNTYENQLKTFVTKFVSLLKKSLEVSEIRYYFKVRKLVKVHNLNEKTPLVEYLSSKLYPLIDYLSQYYSKYTVVDTYDFDDPVINKLREKGVGLIAFFVLRHRSYVGIIILGNKEQDAYTEYEKDLMKNFIDKINLMTKAMLIYEFVHIYAIAQAKTNSKLATVQNELKMLKLKKEEDEKKDPNGDKLSIIGHELKTPLTIARGNMELLHDKIMNAKSITEIDFEYLKKKIDKIFKSISKEIDLVQTLLSSGHVENEKFNFQFSTFNFLEVVDYSYELFSEDGIKKGLYLNYQRPTDYENYIVFSDQSRLLEITNNLISNAIKYTDKGGVDILISQDGERIIFKVKDTGRGIPKHLLHKIGQKYFRIDQYGRGNDTAQVVRSGGTGLGIYVVRNILDAIGGRLTISSEYGVGSTFTAYIPKDVPNYIASRINDLGFMTTNPLAVKIFEDIKMYAGRGSNLAQDTQPLQT